MGDQPLETCLFFVDDSNIWIEAQKFAASGNAHMPKLECSDHDPRLRINVGKLVDTLRRGRIPGRSILYGSRPPPNDSVWKVFKKSNFETKIYDRSSRGKEKEVDNSMATDLSRKATELEIRAEYDPMIKQQKDNTIFVVITGDRDMLPPVKRVLESNIRVELWGWDSGISKEYRRLQSNNGLLEVNFLDSVFKEISFTNFRSTRKNGRIEPGQTIVLCNFVDLDDANETSIGEQLLQLGRLFFITQSGPEPDMYVEFPKVKNIEAMIFEARKMFKDKLAVLPWPEYRSQFHKDPPVIIESGNMYGPLDPDKGLNPDDTATKPQHSTEVEAKMLSVEGSDGEIEQKNAMRDHYDPDDNEGWQTVARSDQNKKHHASLRKSQRCSDGIRCKKKGDCGYQHSDAEHDLFQKYPNRDFGKWKTKMCVLPYRHQTKGCSYAHSQEEAWCNRCGHEGHCVNTEKCPYASVE